MLELFDVSVTLEQRTLVRGVSMTLKKGEVHVLLGPNGSGKSSLVRALMGHPSMRVDGEVQLFGQDLLSQTTEERARRGLHLTPQHIPKLPGVKLVTFLHKAKSALSGEQGDILELYGELIDVARELDIDQGLIDRELSRGLSGGEQKQVECLMLAILKPKVALLDELDSGVDVDRLASIFSAVRVLSETGTIFLIVSHHPSLLRHLAPTHVHVLREGTLCESGGVSLAERVLSSGFDEPMQP